MKTEKFVRLIGSRIFFLATAGLFALEAGWLALTSRFPMAYDEAYHFDFIRFFSHHLNPIITSQTPDTYKFGAIIQDSSFFYHWLMSFPSRLLSFITSDTALQVIGLRLINVGLMVGCLFILRRLARSLGMSAALGNLAVLVFAFTPLVTVLSAQINYDNLLIPATAGCVYLAVSFLRQLREGTFAVATLGWLICLTLLSSLIKFPFLPILTALAALLAWGILRYGRWSDAEKSFRALGRGSKMLLAGALIVSSFLFVRYYGVNMVRYHEPAPRCDRVLNADACIHYYSWHKGLIYQDYKREHGVTADLNLLPYTSWWATINTFELFGAIIPLRGILFVSTPLFIIAALIGTAAFIATAARFRRLIRTRPDLIPLVVISIVYILVLWARNYHDAVDAGQPISLHGRYLLPVLPYCYMVLAFGLRDALDGRRRSSDIKAVLATVTIIAFICLGGFVQQVVRVAPIYGHLSGSEDFSLKDAAPQ